MITINFLLLTGEIMLAELENLIFLGVKNLLGKEISVAELQALYAIYRDIKVIINGKANDEVKKEA